MKRFINKKARNIKTDRFHVNALIRFNNMPQKEAEVDKEAVAIEEVKENEIKTVKSKGKNKKNTKISENNEEKIEDTMDYNVLQRAEDLVNTLSGVDPNRIKVVKNDKGLFERTESSKTILTEDNRQILVD